MNVIREYTPDTPEYMRLEKACAILTQEAQKGTVYTVESTYFDFGLNWTWTTIIASRKGNRKDSYQALYPNWYERIISGQEDVETVVHELMNWKYFKEI